MRKPLWGRGFSLDKGSDEAHRRGMGISGATTSSASAETVTPAAHGMLSHKATVVPIQHHRERTT